MQMCDAKTLHVCIFHKNSCKFLLALILHYIFLLRSYIILLKNIVPVMQNFNTATLHITQLIFNMRSRCPGLMIAKSLRQASTNHPSTLTHLFTRELYNTYLHNPEFNETSFGLQNLLIQPMPYKVFLSLQYLNISQDL